MTAIRVLALALAATLLVACDEPAKAPPPVPSPPKVEPAPVPPAPSKPSEPTTASKPVVVEQAAPTPSKPRQPVAQPAEPLPPVKLDLHLPEESLTPDEPLADLPEQPLLPPLFVEKPAEPGPFQLNGRLITNERVDDYWNSVEGAELQIEFRN